MSTKTALYRHFGKDGELLYIGISYNPFARLSQHELSSSWASLTASMTIEYFESREDALLAEKHAIINDKPIYNIVHNTCSNNDFSELDESIVYSIELDSLLAKIDKMVDNRNKNYPQQVSETSMEYAIRAIKLLMNSKCNLPLLKVGMSDLCFYADEQIDLSKHLDELIIGVDIVLDSLCVRDSEEYGDIVNAVAIDEYESYFKCETESDFSEERYEFVKEAIRKRNRIRLADICRSSTYNNVLSTLRGAIGCSVLLKKAQEKMPKRC